MKTIQEQIYLAFRDDIAKIDTDGILRLQKQWRELRPLLKEEEAGLESYEKSFLGRFVHHSNAIEGSTLTPAQTELVLEGEFVPHDPNTRLKDVFAAKGCCEGMEYAFREAKENRTLDEEFIKNVHEKTALDCQLAVRGIYRLHPVYIRNAKTVPVAPLEVRDCMKDLLYQYSTSDGEVLGKIAAFHAMFERIHPFADGNGRTGRILMNYMLSQEGFPPIAIKYDAKERYLQALESWQVDGESDLFLSLVCDLVSKELEERICIVKETRECVKIQERVCSKKMKKD